MVEFVAFDKNAEVRGVVLQTFRELSQFGSALSKILDKNNIDLDHPAEWYPIQDWLNVKKEIVNTFGQATIFYIGQNVTSDAQWPDDIDSLEKALFSINDAYHMNHRGGDIGFYKTEKISDNEYSVTCCTPYPSYFDQGIIRGLCNQFSPAKGKALVSLDTSKPTRRKGAECCTFSIHIGNNSACDSTEPWINSDRHLMQAVLKEAFTVMNNIYSELESANNTKDQFFNIIAHDLRGPTGSIAYLLSLYAQKERELPVDVVQTVSQHSDKIYQLVDNLLTWAKAQRDGLEVNAECFDLQQTIQDTLGLLTGTAQTKEVTLLPLAGETSPAFADEAMIATVIRNLLNNAIKYSDAGSDVSVKIEKRERDYLVSVTDSGCGIPDSLKNFLFTPGKNRRSYPGTAGEKGTGFGLLLCKEFVDANHGEIGVESTEGKGSRFWFTVPAVCNKTH